MRHWRGASVPPVMRYNEPSGLSSYVVTAVVPDLDAMTYASRRHDQNFLNDISNKLNHVAALAPRPSPSDYLYPSAGGGGTRYTTESYSSHRPPTDDYRRRTWYGTSSPVSDYEVDAYLSSTPKSYSSGGHLSRGVRVTPSPLVSSRTTVTPRWYPGSVESSRSTSVPPRWSHASTLGAGGVGGYLPYQVGGVGLTHTNSYGDGLIGIPYSKLVVNPPRDKYGFGGDNGRPVMTGFAPTISSASYLHAPSFNNNIGYTTSSVTKPGSYRRASIAVPYPVSHYSSSNEYDVDLPSRSPKDSMSSLRDRAYSAQRKLERIPEFRVLEPTRSGTSQTMNGGTSTLEPRKRVKPPMSEARRKVRSLLCRSKNDPHYFDDQ